MNRDSGFSLTAQMLDEYQHLIAEGKLTYGYVDLAKEQFAHHVLPSKGYILEISKLKLIDSTGIGVLVHFMKTYCAGDRKLVVVVNDTLIKELLLIAKLNSLFPICETVQDALILLKNGG